MKTVFDKATSDELIDRITALEEPRDQAGQAAAGAVNSWSQATKKPHLVKCGFFRDWE
jgi:hypothetical protein